MTKTLKNALYLIIGLILADMVILGASLLQIGLEGRTGYWSEFWAIQARFILGL